jgi:hypothetical protein
MKPQHPEDHLSPKNEKAHEKHEEDHARSEKKDLRSPPEVGVQAAPTPGTVIGPTVTIDALFTSVYGTRSADLSATPIYSWCTGNRIIAQWPSVTNNYSAIFCQFEARQFAPSTISQ